MEKEELIKPPAMSDNQFNWRKLCHKIGEKEAKKYLALWLQQTARTILDEDEHDIGVYGYNIKEIGPVFEITVTLSSPWGG